jgi:hypothetical protein
MSQSQSLRINRQPTFAQRRDSTAGLIGAVMIHVGIIVATLFTFAHKLDIVDQSTPIVPVDLITIGDKTNIKATITKQQKDIADQETVTPSPSVAPPAAAQPAEDKAEPAPSDTLKKTDALLKPQTKPTPPEQKKQKFDINNIMAMLDQNQPKAASPNAKVGTQGRVAECQGWNPLGERHRRARCDDGRSADRAQQPDHAVLEPTGRRPERERSGRRLRSISESGRFRRTTATIDWKLGIGSRAQPFHASGRRSCPSRDLYLRAL